MDLLDVSKRVSFEPRRSCGLSVLTTSSARRWSSSKRRLCLFERSAGRWWSPRFDSDVLERQYRRTTLPRLRRRMQIGLAFVLAAALLWHVYLCASVLTDTAQRQQIEAVATRARWPMVLASSGTLLPLLAMLMLSICGKHKMVQYRGPWTAVCVLFVCVTSLVPAGAMSGWLPAGHHVTSVQLSAAAVITVLIIYTMMPLPLYATVIVTCCYSCALEAFILSTEQRNFTPASNITPLLTHSEHTCDSNPTAAMVAVRVALHLCTHLLGVRILLLAQSHMRSTFTTVGHTLLTQQQLEREKRLKEDMIHSVMPPSLANWVRDELREDAPRGSSVDGGVTDSSSAALAVNAGPSGPHISFRPFNMQPMYPVSILFADIVGFTKMASDKSAACLVALLNDLFGRFDALCCRLGCEKISTLGDCYYCVSGCPRPRADHAHCCVRMGLAMVVAIREFDADNSQSVNMRVGVHTGRVLCGLVGTKRFKFDVWSNDVLMANRLEATGRPGTVHISQNTLNYLNNQYIVQPTDPVNGVNTYFISGRRRSALMRSEPNSPSGDVVQTPQLIRLNQPAAQLSADQPSCDSEQLAKSCSMPNVVGSCTQKSKTTSDHRLTSLDRKQPGLIVLQPSVFSGQAGENVRRPHREHRTMGDLKILGTDQSDDYATHGCHGNIVVGAAEVDGVDASLSELSDTALSLASARSRKDSGIRSRRSSIQMVTVDVPRGTGDAALRRLSDYYTSSQSSLPAAVKSDTVVELCADGSASLSQETDGVACTVHLLEQQTATQRKLSDMQMIRCVRQMSTQSNYFLNPPVHPITLNYTEVEFERHYRRHQTRLHHGSFNTLALPEYNIVIDTTVAGFVLLVVCVSLAGSGAFTPPGFWTPLVVGWLLLWLLLLLLLAVCMKLLWPTATPTETTPNCHSPHYHHHHTQQRHSLCTDSGLAGSQENTTSAASGWRRRLQHLYSGITNWYVFHALGAIVISLPVAAVLTAWRCANLADMCHAGTFYFMLFVGLAHFCSFTQLNCWTKTCLVAAAAGVSCWNVLLPSDACAADHPFAADWETAVACLLLVVLVAILNREFEISYRLGFCVNLVAARDKAHVQTLRNQADWLLHNIFPSHVTDTIRSHSQYSSNHTDVVVMFASIVNFHDLYDETYRGGREYLRVLNEIISDIDDLLDRYSSVEKIKTIGSTYMAVAGLSRTTATDSGDEDEDAHLVEMVRFASDMQQAVAAFNASLFEFELLLRIGVHAGDVTAGVIGTTKLYFDIWGDTVNTASRMDSTGQPRHIHVTETCAHRLAKHFQVQQRGEIFIKGKGLMTTYFVGQSLPNVSTAPSSHIT